MSLRAISEINSHRLNVSSPEVILLFLDISLEHLYCLLRYSQSRSAGTGLPSQSGQIREISQSIGDFPEKTQRIHLFGRVDDSKKCCQGYHLLLTAAELFLPHICDFLI